MLNIVRARRIDPLLGLISEGFLEKMLLLQGVCFLAHDLEQEHFFPASEDGEQLRNRP